MSAPVKKVPIHLQSSQNRLLIRNGQVVNDNESLEADVYIEDGIVKEMGKNLIIPGGTRIIDARGKFVMPGGIDPHVHFDFNFMNTTVADNYYQGTKAAVAGGTTTIINFAIPQKKESILDMYFSERQKADSKVCCDYALHMGVTHWSDQVKREIEILCKEHGVNSFKAFMAYSFMLNDGELYELFDTCKSLGALPMVHAENGNVISQNVKKCLEKGINGPEGHGISRDETVEAEAVNRAIMIANQLSCPLYVVHIMSKLAALTFGNAPRNNNKLFGETLVAALACDGSQTHHQCFEHAAGFILSPPLRNDKSTPEALMNLLNDSVIQLTGSDHCVFTKKQKAIGKNDFSKIPNGVNGVEERLSVIWEKGVNSGILSPEKFVSVTSTMAAKIFNLYPRKGIIAPGSDADIVIWDTNKTKVISADTHHSAGDFNIFEGMKCHGVPEYVIVNGRVCVDEGQLRAVEGHGKYLETNCYCPFIYNLDITSNEVKASDGINGTSESNIQILSTPKNEDIYTPPVAILPNSAVCSPSCKGPRPEGQRNIQDSTFSISEELDLERRACIKVKNPPGGKSSGFW